MPIPQQTGSPKIGLTAWNDMVGVVNATETAVGSHSHTSSQVTNFTAAVEAAALTLMKSMNSLVSSEWNGTNYPHKGTAITAARRTGSGDLAGIRVRFVGDPDPNALGIMVNGDEWKDPTP